MSVHVWVERVIASESRGRLTRTRYLKHALDEDVDLGAPLSCVAALVEVEKLLAETTVGVGQLERPQEVVGRLEVGSDRVDLVDEVLHADDARLAKGTLDNRVVGDRDALLVHLEGRRSLSGRGVQRFITNK